MRTLVDILRTSARQFKTAPALTMRIGFRTVTYSYDDVLKMAKRTALFLADRGIKKGDAVLLCAPNSPYWCIVYWACLLRGAVVVPLNIQSSEQILKAISKQTEARIIFHHNFFKFSLPSSVEEFRIEYLPELIEGFKLKDFKAHKAGPDDSVQIMYTSGTTGDPKGVLLTHRNILTNIKALTKVLQLQTGRERMLSILPLSHIFEQTIGFQLPFLYGAHIIFAHAHSAIRSLLKEYRITKLIAVPEFLHLVISRLEAQLEKTGKKKLFDHLIRVSQAIGSKRVARLLFGKLHRSFGGKLEMIASGGAPLDPELEAKWMALGFDILQGYGLTETSPVLTCNTFEHHKIGSVGRVLDGVKMRFADNGEIQVKGPSIFQGYYKNKKKTRQVFTKDGWFKTGDIGELDEDGFLFLKGRQKYMILSAGGQNVFPQDVELELSKVAGVKDSCVIGLTKHHGSVEIHAVLCLEPDEKGKHADPEQIVDAANENLASYQVINSWSVWPEDDFPRTATKKVKRGKVIEWAHKEQSSAQHSGQGAQVSKLVALIAAVTGVDGQRIKPKTKIRQLNVDSLMRVELVARIEEDFGVLLDEHKITPQLTIEGLEQQIKNYVPPKQVKVLKAWPLTWPAKIARFMLQYPLFWYVRWYAKVKVQGLHNLKGLDQPVIFMPNHLSYADAVLVLRSLPPRFRWNISFAAAHDMLYEEFSQYQFLGELLLNAFSFPRKEHENIKPGLERMGRILDKGFHTVVFPEGKISKNGKLLDLKKGAGLVAVEMGSPVVPVHIEGIQEILPYDHLKPVTKGTVTVTFGEQITFNRSDEYEDAAQRIEDALRGMG